MRIKKDRLVCFYIFILSLPVKHSEIKKKIIETASFLFYKKGYNSTGINEIISEAGIAKATLYNHFKSKEDICISYLQFRNENFLQDLKAFCISKPKGSAQILAIFDFLQLFYKNKDFNGCWCLNTVSEIPKENIVIREEIKKQKNLFIQQIVELINENMEGLTAIEKRTLANGIYLLYEGAVAESNLHQSDWPIIEAKSLCRQILK